jgi:hypothetical protein
MRWAAPLHVVWDHEKHELCNRCCSVQACCRGGASEDAVGVVGVPVAEGAFDAAKCALAEAAPVGGGTGRRRSDGATTRCTQQ